VALKCDVCGKPIHLKKIENKQYPIKCPLEKFKEVKYFYTKEFKQLLNGLFSGESFISNSPEALEEFSKVIPETTLIMEHVKKYDNEIYTKNLIIQSSKENFFLHFNRVLIDVFENNDIHFVDCTQEIEKNQFNYLWLTPSNLRECYFKTGLDNLRFKSLSELSIPALVIYPIGGDSVENKAWGDILLDLLTNRESLGKPTWILKSREFSKCQEITSSEKLRSYMTRNSKTPTIEIDSDIDSGGDAHDFEQVVVNKENRTIENGNTKVNASTYGM